MVHTSEFLLVWLIFNQVISEKQSNTQWGDKASPQKVCVSAQLGMVCLFSVWERINKGV